MENPFNSMSYFSSQAGRIPFLSLIISIIITSGSLRGVVTISG